MARSPRLDAPGRTTTRPWATSSRPLRALHRVGRSCDGYAGLPADPSLFCVVWILWNTLMPDELRFDDAALGFTALTLMLSLQASYAAPLILLAQNRQDDRDRVQIEQDRQRAERNPRRHRVPRPRESSRCGCRSKSATRRPSPATCSGRSSRPFSPSSKTRRTRPDPAPPHDGGRARPIGRRRSDGSGAAPTHRRTRHGPRDLRRRRPRPRRHRADDRRVPRGGQDRSRRARVQPHRLPASPRSRSRSA